MLDGQLTVDADQPVQFTFTVRNGGDEPVTLEFSDACKADFVVSDDATQQERWRWSEGRMFAQVLSDLTLTPGDTETFEAAWDDPAPGTYTARAELTSDESCAAAASFSIP
ncbi:BsuPI-related putative proteinase inhibitor [Halocatena salina]|uniref:Intracellular proteinase inhibitor BsuPI domain-containing protein n=1 Tax=Halocatena salina TaxID=2934340 RepID=A0A8U0A2T8_9EURY|nr:BsuPI-related putative proteinase inhibitor [Halocatena salina]UPM42297.1 BsuPI-related putative proteinase inhibitor [Halocatena salina]